MTAICGGGPSAAKPGFAATLYIGPAALGALLNNIPTLWAVPLAGAIGLVTYDLTTFCVTDPPPVPDINAVDVANLLAFGNPILQALAIPKFQQLVGAYAWYQVCECTSVVTPQPPPPPPDPGVSINPTIAPPIVGSPHCYEVHRRITAQNLPAYPHMTGTAYDLGSVFLSNPAFTAQSGDTGPTLPFYTLPTGISQSSAHTIAYNVPWSNPGEYVQGQYADAAGNIIGTFQIRIAESGAEAIQPPQAVPAGAKFASMYYSNFESGFIGTVDVDIDFWWDCTTSSNVTEPCCPPDDVLQQQVSQILENVRLIQRQMVPFAYIRSTAHAGLQGDGHIAVQGLIGCIVQLTAFPSNVGIEDGDPLVYWDAGWFNWGNADGSSERIRITASPQISLPAAAGQYTRIGYSLPAGVTATITELVRES